MVVRVRLGPAMNCRTVPRLAPVDVWDWLQLPSDPGIQRFSEISFLGLRFIDVQHGHLLAAYGLQSVIIFIDPSQQDKVPT